MICKLFQRQGAPNVEVDKFSCNPLEYPLECSREKMYRWNRKVHGIRRSYGRETCLSDFYRFVNEEAILPNITQYYPIFSREYFQAILPSTFKHYYPLLPSNIT